MKAHFWGLTGLIVYAWIVWPFILLDYLRRRFLRGQLPMLKLALPLDLLPEVSRDIDEVIEAHSQTVATPVGAKQALGSGLIGSLIAGPVIRLVIARLVPVLQAQALAIVDAEVAKLKVQYPTLDLSFVHGIVESVFAAVLNSMPAPGSNPTPGPSPVVPQP